MGCKKISNCIFQDNKTKSFYFIKRMNDQEAIKLKFDSLIECQAYSRKHK